MDFINSGQMGRSIENVLGSGNPIVRAMDEMSGRVKHTYILRSLPGKKETSAQDAFISKDGNITHLSNDDNILATKKGAGMGKNINVKIDFSGMNLNIANASQSEAGNFSTSIVKQIRDALFLELSRTGAF
jgi:hypothetical protein